MVEDNQLLQQKQLSHVSCKVQTGDLLQKQNTSMIYPREVS